jgi:hypothetical protein
MVCLGLQLRNTRIELNRLFELGLGYAFSETSAVTLTLRT